MDKLIGKEIEGYRIEGWRKLDKDTVLVWCEPKIDCEGDEYRLEIEYWKNEGSWSFTKVYEHELVHHHGLTGYERAAFMSAILPLIEKKWSI